ncbi:MAG: hypothetical protein U0271_02995 [Polyangiaceae bacterium]
MKRRLLVLVAVGVATVSVGVTLLFITRRRDKAADAATTRLSTVEASFVELLHGDFERVDRAAKTLGADAKTREAIAARDPVRARALAETFVGADANLEVLFSDPRGEVIATVGTEHPVKDLAEIPDLMSHPFPTLSVLRGNEFHEVVWRGCGADASHSTPAYVAAQPSPSGVVVVCMRIGSEYVAHAAEVLGVELAVLGDGDHFGSRDSTFFGSEGFDHDTFLAWWDRPKETGPFVVKVQGRAVAVVGFRPKELSGLLALASIDLQASPNR